VSGHLYACDIQESTLIAEAEETEEAEKKRKGR